jgi:hypothetical protein
MEQMSGENNLGQLLNTCYQHDRRGVYEIGITSKEAVVKAISVTGSHDHRRMITAARLADPMIKAAAGLPVSIFIRKNLVCRIKLAGIGVSGIVRLQNGYLKWADSLEKIILAIKRAVSAFDVKIGYCAAQKVVMPGAAIMSSIRQRREGKPGFLLNWLSLPAVFCFYLLTIFGPSGK